MIGIIWISNRLVKTGLCKRFIVVRKKVPKASKDVLTFPCGSGILTKLFDGDEVQKLSGFESEKDSKKVLDKRN